MRHRNRSGFSIVEIVCSLSLLGAGVMGVEAMHLRSLAESPEGRLQRQAVEVARNQLDYIQRLPAGQIDVGADFSPASWLQSPGLAPGQLPGRAGSAEGIAPLGVEVRIVANGDATEYTVRVRWVEPDGDDRVHELNTVRAS
jgi:hypothetical protein